MGGTLPPRGALRDGVSFSPGGGGGSHLLPWKKILKRSSGVICEFNINLSKINTFSQKLTLPKNPYKHTRTYQIPFQSLLVFITDSNASIAPVPRAVVHYASCTIASSSTMHP